MDPAGTPPPTRLIFLHVVFFLFPLLKKRLRGREYGDVARLEVAVQRELAEITQRQWELCFADWVWRCRRCLVFDGGYFEGMKFPPQN